MKVIRSKYQKKNYEEIIYHLDEETCHTCGRVFSIDLDRCNMASIPDQARAFAKYFCPYCAKPHIKCI